MKYESPLTHWLKIAGGLMVLAFCMFGALAFFTFGLNMGFGIGAETAKQAFGICVALIVPIAVMFFFIHVSGEIDKDQKDAGK